MKITACVMTLGALALIAAPARAGSIFFLETGMIGAEAPIDANDTVTWDFTPASTWELAGGIFTMKDGSQTDADITLTLTDLTDSTVLDSFTLTPGDFTQTYSAITFAFTNPDPLTAGDNYQLQLTSSVADTHDYAYFIKDVSGAAFYDPSGTPQSVDPAPEPTAVSTLALGSIGIFFAVRRRRRAGHEKPEAPRFWRLRF